MNDVFTVPPEPSLDDPPVDPVGGLHVKCELPAFTGDIDNVTEREVSFA